MNKLAFLSIFLALLLLGCSSQQAQPAPSVPTPSTPSFPAPVVPATAAIVAAKGDIVQVDYIGSLDDGTVFDTSLKAEAEKAGLALRPSYAPLEFTVGAGQMIDGFDAAVVGMKEGEEKTVRILPAAAYGSRDEELVVSMPHENLPGEVNVGDQFMNAQGMTGIAIDVNNQTIKIDFNHPLAGKTLTFQIFMRKITKATR